MPSISVIVPVYKVEKYLDRCVKSVLDQTFTDFELILVDDGSPDRCPALCDEWAAKDSRIRVIHKKNGGLSDARNAGIDAARGEYLFFADSDDYLHRCVLEALYGGLRSLGVQICACDYVLTDGEPLPTEPPQVTAESWKPERFFLDTRLGTVAWAKLYHKSCFSGVRYPFGKIHEDQFTTHKLLFAQAAVGLVPFAGYGYFRNQEGITRSNWTPGRLDVLEAVEEKLVFFREGGFREVLEDQYRYYVSELLAQAGVISRLGQKRTRRKYLRLCRRKLRRILPDYRRVLGRTFRQCLEAYLFAYPVLGWGLKAKSLFRINK